MFMSSSHLISYLDAATLYLKRDQMELTAMLRVFKRLHPRVCVMYNNPRNTQRSSHEKLLDILSWIAVLFKDGGRSNVAAALKISDNLPPALIISTDQGSVPTETDQAIMDHFKALTFLALKAPNDTALHIAGFNYLLVQHAWPQIQADMKTLRDTHFKLAGVEVIVDIKTRYAAMLLSSVGLNEDEFEKGCINHVIDRTKDLFKDGLIEALDDLDTADRD